MGVDIIELAAATYNTLFEKIEHEEFDAFYFLGHGQLNPDGGGDIFLEDGLSSAAMPATVLAQRLNQARWRVYFAYFNSCDTGTVDSASNFAGVAERVLADGRIPAVLAQQAPIKANESMKIAEAVLRRIREGESPEAAILFARSEARGTTWGIPVLYTHLRGPEEFERNRIGCLLGAEIGKTRFGIVLPSFLMGVRLDGHGEVTRPKRGTYKLSAPIPITVMVKPEDTFVFPGETYARDDIEAARDIESLLFQIAKPENVRVYQSPQQDGVTHWFLFGSLSSRYVENVLRNYSPRFGFRRLKDKWCLDELDSAGNVIEPTNEIPVPYSLGQRDYAKQEDLGIIEKITDPENGRVFFIIAGLGSRATRGCGWYLSQRWSQLLKQNGSKDFGVILRFPGDLPPSFAKLTIHRASTIPLQGQQSSLPPPPRWPVDLDDPQSKRWGGVHEQSGRKIDARLLDFGKDSFWFDLVVRPTDESALVGPVLFHLHDSYPRSIIRISSINNNEAVLEAVEANEVFTAAAQSKDKDGQWVGLEYDLAHLPGLPKRFGGPGVRLGRASTP
jgi:hypothetical protein